MNFSFIEALIHLDEQAKKILLDIARKSIAAAIKRLPISHITCNHPDLQEQQGAFVTLKTHGNLRGCIGRFVSDIPLYQLVSEIAISSATEDPRFEFNRIKPSELNHLEIEISVLSPLKLIQNPLDFELGKHGIFIKRGPQIGCFLPQVATETGWSKEEFLSHCCSGKAGLPDDSWKYGDVEIYTFTAEIIEEKHSG
ncbi:MAG TPA: AmmeMemoRadiSam system protein A [Candidatus Wunengus sp. YC65]|uniref:AmmeMemoRadiSam system protein A n=1 Tax=Candidatus Wunengus sp. YC65 TaxID=3367701 RepID=UPI004028298B